MQHEILNEIHNNPAINNNPIVTSISYASGWIGSGILMFVGSIGEATDSLKFAGAVGGLIMLCISMRKGYMDNQIKKAERRIKVAEAKIKECEAKKAEKELHGSGN